MFHFTARTMMRSVFMVMACGLIIVQLSSANRTIAAQSSRLLLANFSLHFVCKGEPRDDVENSIELFLVAKNFKVLNQADIQRQHDVHLFGTSMVALDRDLRMIEIKSVPGADQRYSLYLYSRPPTNHSALEEEILNLISKNLRCETRQVARKENRVEQKEFYESEIRRVKSLFEEADRINGRRRI
jgi:hypothetical protein